MTAARLRRAAGVLAAGIGAGLLGSAGSVALEPPPSALSTALLTPVPLLDDPANTFLFPHLDADLEPALFAYAGTGNSVVSATGARVRTLGQTLHYQTRTLPSETASRLAEHFESPFSQAGWATALGSLRVGAAFTWSTGSARRTRRGYRDLISGRGEIFDSRFRGVDVREGAVGLGWEGPIRVDAVVELCSERLHYDDTRLTRALELSLALEERESTTMEAKARIRPGGAVRVTVPLGDRKRLRLLARARDTAQDLDRTRAHQLWRNAVLVVDSVSTEPWDSKGSELSAGILLESAPRGSGHAWAAHGFYERVRSAWRYTLSGSSGARSQIRSDRGELGGSFRTPGPWELEFLGAVSVSYGEILERREDRFTLEQGIVLRSAGEAGETGAVMAWGARRSFRQIDLSATLRTYVLPLNPIASLDIRVPL